jgi:ribosomal protein L37AE/L43A
MPKRGCEFYQSGDLRCCPKCNRFGKYDYDEKSRCWVCGWCSARIPDPRFGEKLAELTRGNLYVCTTCGEPCVVRMSDGYYECLNPECEQIYNPSYILKPVAEKELRKSQSRERGKSSKDRLFGWFKRKS